MIFLTDPDAQYRESFLQGLREFQQEGRMLEYNIESVSENFTEFVQRLRNQRQQTNLPPDRVPALQFWLIDDEEFIGRLTLRYPLNEVLLRIGGHIGYQVRPSKRHKGYGKKQLSLGLQKARELGLTRVLVTCDENNIASQKVIEYNKGKLENSILVEGSPIRKLRYWIELDAGQ